MAESETSKVFRELIAELDPHCVENLLPSESGMPDVEFIGGWAELKWMRSTDLPKRATTKVRFDHYTDKQREWLMNRTLKGETCWLVVQIGREWFFYDADAAQEVGYLTYDEMVEHATKYFPTKPTSQEVVSLLTSH